MKIATWVQCCMPKSKRYRRSLILALLMMSLPGLAIGFIIFIVSTTQIERELQAVHQNQLKQMVKTIDDQLSYLEQSMAHWAFDFQFNESLKEIDFAYKYEQIHDIYRTLLIIEGSNTLVDHMELYVNEPDRIVFTKEGYRFIDDEEDAASHYESYLHHSSYLYWQLNAGGKGASLRLVHKIPGISSEPFGALIMYLHEGRLRQLLEMLTPYNGGTTFLYEKDAGWLVNRADREAALDEAVLERLLEKDDPSGTFFYDWEHKAYSVMYGVLTRLGTDWIYASAVSLDSITSPVIAISQLIIAASSLILLVAIALSWLASRRLYSPVEHLVNKITEHKAETGRKTASEFELIESQWNDLSKESEQMQNLLHRQLPRLREGFLLQLLNGYMYSYTEEELAAQMESVGRAADGRVYSLAYVQLMGISKENGKFSVGDEGLVTFAAANMIEELLQQFEVQADVINFHDLSVGTLISLPSSVERASFGDVVKNITEEIIAAVDRMLHMEVIVCIGRTTGALKELPSILEEAKIAVGFRNVNVGNQIIEIEKLGGENREQHLEYPFDLDKQIVHAVRIGKEEEAMERLHDFVRALSEQNVSESAMKQGTLHLLGSIMHVVMQSGLDLQTIYDGDNLYEQLGQIREPSQLAEWFRYKVIRPFVREIAQKQNMQTRLLIEKAVEMLHRDYKKDISLDLCADALNISPFVLSKMFKEVAGINFIDYLTNIRLEKSRQLLRDTDLKISEVAEEVGYQHSYFNRIFKKQEGVTPTQYREMSRLKT
ncbi:AraC family transcriptional regulator [Paenibacillus cisolokensis]|uniref:AraC family transcriptional regulator n=1 Tax=Paenibacillus cisolokensis TaxID=1658519 RepID=UPI003D2E0516